MNSSNRFWFASPREKSKVVRLGLQWFRVVAPAILCVLPVGAREIVRIPQQVVSQQALSPSATNSPDQKSTEKQSSTGAAASTPNKKPAAHAPAHKAQSQSSSSAKKATAPHSRSARGKKRRPISPRVRRIRQAFVASTTLRPMAQQLIQDRTPTAYAGVEVYARAHAKEDAGALAWLVVGYARVLDHDCAKAIDPLNRAQSAGWRSRRLRCVLPGHLLSADWPPGRRHGDAGGFRRGSSRNFAGA